MVLAAPATEAAAAEELRLATGRRTAPELAACQRTLAGAVDLRSAHLRGLKDVLTANRGLELKLCDTDAQLAAVAVQNTALEAELMRAQSGEAAAPPPPPPPPPSGAAGGGAGGPVDSTEQLLARLRYIDVSVLKIQRVSRGFLGRRRALRVAMHIASGGGRY